MTFGQRLSNAREEAGLTQEELAKKLYVTRQGLSRWENDKTQPSIETFGLICNILNKPPEYFIEVKEEIGRRLYKELSWSEKTVAVNEWKKSRCKFVTLNFWLLTVASNFGVGVVTWFTIRLIYSGYSLPAVYGVIGGVMLWVACVLAIFLLSIRYSALYNAYLLSEMNVVRTNKLFHA